MTEESRSAFTDYLTQNELGLALDVLVDLAEHVDAAAPCWTALLAAVEEMSLQADDDLHAEAVQLVLAHNPNRRGAVSRRLGAGRLRPDHHLP